MLPNAKEGLLFACEQVFTCLLESYRPDVGQPTGNKLEYLEAFIADAKYMVDAAASAQTLSLWPGGCYSRPREFGATMGYNLATPLNDFAKDRTLLVRTDAYHELENGEVVEIANFRRATQKTAHWIQHQTNRPSHRMINLYHMTPFKLTKELPLAEVQGGFKMPGEGTLFHVVFEVRLDGKRHPKGFARLLEIKSFVNQDIANSWAIRVEWKGPSGEAQTRYLQRGSRLDRPKKAARRRTNAYLRSQEVLHHLMNLEYPQDVRRSYSKDFGKSNVLQAHHDDFLQTIEFGPQKPYPLTINYNRIDDDTMIDDMTLAGLENVDADFNTRSAHGDRCDTCLLQSLNQRCVRAVDASGKVCYNCYHCYHNHGGPACSWTSNNETRTKVDHDYRAWVKPLLVSPLDVSNEAEDTIDADLEEVPLLSGEESYVSDDNIDL